MTTRTAAPRLTFTQLAPVALAIGSLFLAACGDGDDGATGTDGLSSLVNISSINAGDERCALGGQLIETGLDSNRDGLLTADEVNADLTQVVCQMAGDKVSASLIGRYQSGIYGLSASEIVDYHAPSNRIYVVNAKSGRVDVLDGEPLTAASSVVGSDALALNNLTKLTELDVAKDVNVSNLGSVNSVSVWGNMIAAAIERGDDAGNTTQANGFVAFYHLDEAGTASFVKAVEVGALPDNVVFSPNGEFVLVANEGEPNSAYTVDPEGSIAMISTKDGVIGDTATIIGFSDYNVGGAKHDELDASVKINGPMASVAQDFEPEYIAINHDSSKAFVSLQENNALAIIDIASAKVIQVAGLGLKDFGLAQNSIDASDKDDAVNLQAYPGVYGMYQPDTIATYTWGGKDFVVSANEGDSRDYAGFSEEARAADLVLDANHPQVAAAQDKTQLARLKVTVSMGDDDNDGDYDKIVAYGARSFSIWSAQGQQVFDSANDIGRITAAILGDDFNNNNEENKGDSRSDDKGAEPEALALGQIGNQTFAFVGLERTGGFMIYNITNPFAVQFVDYVINRDFGVDVEIDTDTGEVTGDASLVGDLGPEGMKFVSAQKSPTGKPMLIIGNEVSGTTSVYEIKVQ